MPGCHNNNNMVTIIPKAAPKESLWQSLLFYFSLGLFVAVILSYFIIGNLEERTTDNIKEVQLEIDQVADKDDIMIESQVLAIKEKTEAFSLLFEDHRRPSRFFEMLEKNTHPDVQFNKIELGSVSLRAELEGFAPNFKAVGQQLYIFQGELSIKEIKLTGLSLGANGEAVFSLDIFLSPAVFK